MCFPPRIGTNCELVIQLVPLSNPPKLASQELRAPTHLSRAIHIKTNNQLPPDPATFKHHMRLWLLFWTGKTPSAEKVVALVVIEPVVQRSPPTPRPRSARPPGFAAFGTEVGWVELPRKVDKAMG